MTSFGKKAGVVSVVCLAVVASAWAQFGAGHMGAQLPTMPNMMNPVLGSGAAYQMTSPKGTMNFAYAVVGKEQVSGSDAYWVELRMESQETQGEMVMKSLMVPDPTHPQLVRMIVQPPGRPPMEMPAGMMSMMHGAQPGAKPEDNSLGEKIGSETVTVPAGTYECDHYRKTNENGTALDLWISNKISPYGLVKMTNGDVTMLLQKTLTNETSHIKGEPQKMPQF